MTNKEKLKSAIEKDMNSKVYYDEIIKKIEEGEKMKINNIWKWSFVPICLVVIISGMLFFGTNNSAKKIQTKSYVDQENNITLNINEITNSNNETFKLDADIKIAGTNGVNIPSPYKGEIKLPKDLNKDYGYLVYTREDRDSKDYDILNNYIIGYTDGNDRTIEVAFSEKYKPVRDYFFSEEGSTETMINGVKLIIYNYNGTYYTTFNYNGYNFDIETSNITRHELATFLLSILK